MKDSFTGNPADPTFLLRILCDHFRGGLAGTPKTEAGPERNVVMPI